MTIHNFSEFHYIAHCDNLTSIMELGILSHNRADSLKKADISMDSVQRLRAQKVIPKELTDRHLTVHDCANLYFNAKNPMLYKRKDEQQKLCVLRVRHEVMDLPGAFIADRNAAVGNAQFHKTQEAVNKLALGILCGAFWTDRNVSQEENKARGQFRCAELLVPDQIHPSYIGGMYVSSEKTKSAVEHLFNGQCPVPITVHPQFFFEKTYVAPTISPLSNKRFPLLLQPVPAPLKRQREETTVDQPQKARKIENGQSIAKAMQSDTIPPAALPTMKVVTYTSPKKGLDRFFVRKDSEGLLKADTAYTLTLPSNIEIKDGNLFNSPMQTLVNTVNCQGVMGKGIALEFKKKYPKMFAEYRKLCEKNEVLPGVPYIYESSNGKQVLNFPTKKEYRKPSKLVWIEEGLDTLVANYQAWNITSIALPPLGCGNGKLDWRVVRALMIKKLGHLPIKVEIYQPNEDVK